MTNENKNLGDFFVPHSRILSEEEVRKREEELIQERITPELLRYFRKEEAYELVSAFYKTPTSSHRDIYRIDTPEAEEFLAKEVKGRRIIELGSNGNDNYKLIFGWLGAKSYEFADPKYNVEGLTALIRQPDESAIICSFALFADAVLYPYISDGVDPAIFERYRKELTKQMYRVTPRNGITLHGIEDWCLGNLENAGFVVENSVPEQLKHRSLMGFKMCVLRKR
jgi:hypothetical protein